MYIPPHFIEDRQPILHDAIRAAGLATLVTMTTEGLLASPLPLMLDDQAGPHGTLYGHLARANPQWRTSDPAVEALVTFMGPDAYISPSWYETKRETGKVVPTWNYLTVHAYGPITFFADAAELLDVVTRLTTQHEGARAEPWAVDDAPAPFIQSQLKGIVGFRMPITRLQGKWKFSQNRSTADRAGVADGLVRDGHDEAAILVPQDRQA